MVVVVVLLVELVTSVAGEPDGEPLDEPGAPIELVLPGEVPAVLLEELPVSLEPDGGDEVVEGVVVAVRSVVVDVVDDVEASRLVQAPRDREAATMASAAKVVSDFFMGALLECYGRNGERERAGAAGAAKAQL